MLVSRLLSRSLTVVVAVLAFSCGDDDSPSGSPKDPNSSGGSGPSGEAERFAQQEFEVVGAEGQLDDPEQDDSVKLGDEGTTELLELEPGEPITVSIPFEAENGNVVGAGIRFGDDGPIITVPMPDMAGATSGTLVFQVDVPASLCKDLGSVCHSIRCYEFAVTDAGMVSAANIQAMAAVCGHCTEPSCIGLIEGCEVDAGEMIDTVCNAPPVETVFGTPGTAPNPVVDDQYVYFGIDEDVVRLNKDGSGTPDVIVPGEDPLTIALAGDRLLYQGLADIHIVAKNGGEATMLGFGSGTMITDGEAVFTGEYLLCTAPVDIKRFEFDGGESVLVEDATCVTALAVDDEFLYWIDEVDEDSSRVMKVTKTGGEPEEVVPAGDISGPLLVDDKYLYYMGEEDTYQRPIVRALKDGSGSADELTPAVLAGGMVVDPRDGALYFSEESLKGCLRRIDRDGTVTAIGSLAGSFGDVAQDDDYVYALTVDAGLKGKLVRARKKQP